jgi:hypothetical protein
MTYAIDDTQHRWAVAIGAAYLIALVLGNIAEFYIPDQLIVYDNAVQTARNIMAHEHLFRLGLAANFLVFATDVVLVAGLYMVLEPVNRGLAMLAAFFRLIETTALFMVTLSDFAVLKILGGAEYLKALDTATLAILARLAIAGHGSAYTLGLLIFGFGSTIFCWLWLKSGYVPKPLAMLGVFASAWIGACVFAIMVAPEAAKVLPLPVWAAPIFIFELAMGLWLVIKRLPQSPSIRGQPL